ACTAVMSFQTPPLSARGKTRTGSTPSRLPAANYGVPMRTRRSRCRSTPSSPIWRPHRTARARTDAPAAAAATPSTPRDADGPVLRGPWEARACALAVALHTRGGFTWRERAECLAAAIKRARAAGDADTGTTYYHRWLATLETLVTRKGVASDAAL